MSAELSYKLKTTIALTMIMVGFIMMIIAKVAIRMNPDKDVHKFRIISKLGNILIKLSVLVIMWAVVGLFSSNPDV